MDNLMTKSFQDRFYEELNRRFDAQEKRMGAQDKVLSDILEQARKTNGRVNGLEEREKNRESRKLNIPSNILYLIAFGGVVALLIVARILGIEVGAFI